MARHHCMTPVLALLLALGGCGLDTAKITPHAVYADDGAELRTKQPVSFAVVGATRSSLPRQGQASAALETIQDVRGEIPMRGLEFVVLTGGYVRVSSTGEWESFAKRWTDVLESNTVSTNQARKPALALPGSNEYLGDTRLRGYGAAFQDIGRNIGQNRVASWSAFDVDVKGTTWRFVFLDANRAGLGSRWKEQVFWLPKVVTGDDFDKLLVFMTDPLVTMTSTPMDPDDGPSELLEIIEDHTEVMKLHGVFTGGAPSNEVYMHSGNFGEVHVLAGNAGVPAQNLRRWGPADEAGLKDVSLAVGYDLGLLKEFDLWVEQLGFADRIVDQAKARGSWEGFTAEFDAEHFPIQGWWQVTLDGPEIELTFRIRRHDGTFHDLYTTRYTEADGWGWKT